MRGTTVTELLITDATMWLGGERGWRRGDVLVRDGVIAAVEGTAVDGTAVDGTAADGATGRVEVVDAGGAALLPGFHDTHVHPPFAGAALLGIDLTPVHDADQYAEIIRAHGDAHPDQAVLTGAGWYGDVYEGGFPTRQQLDAIVADRPLILNSHDGHGVWANSAAIEAAGLTDDVADPPGGRFVRDREGRLSGVFLDTAVAPIDAIRPDPPADHVEQSILAAQQHLHGVGITTWHDAAVGKSELGPDTFDAYMSLEAQGLLAANVVLCQWWDRDRGHEQIDAFRERRDLAATTTHLRANTVKVMLDGMIENRTAAMLEPYSGTDVRGDSFIEPGVLAELVTALDAEGFQVHLHAVGDRAVREALDALQAARSANGPTDNRHQITHLDVVDEADVPRFAELDATANVQMLWARQDVEIVERKLPLMGPDRAGRHFPFGALHRAGARIAAGSDWPVSDPNPLWAIHTGVTRLAPAGDPHANGDAFDVPLLPDEALPVEVALDAFTGTAAWVGRLDERTGRIAPGMDADLVLLDRDVSSGAGLDQARVVRTWVRGEVVGDAVGR
jgi:predicted amidohydrolase YtcJ